MIKISTNSLNFTLNKGGRFNCSYIKGLLKIGFFNINLPVMKNLGSKKFFNQGGWDIGNGGWGVGIG